MYFQKKMKNMIKKINHRENRGNTAMFSVQPQRQTAFVLFVVKSFIETPS